MLKRAAWALWRHANMRNWIHDAGAKEAIFPDPVGASAVRRVSRSGGADQQDQGEECSCHFGASSEGGASCWRRSVSVVLFFVGDLSMKYAGSGPALIPAISSIALVMT